MQIVLPMEMLCMNNNILITGAKGQLGQELQLLVEEKNHDLPQATFYFTDRDSLDICDEDKLNAYINAHMIDTIINCAAYTNVDKAEDDEDLAFAINSTAVKSMATLAAKKAIRLIHVSTDYVFDGKSYRPIDENTPTNPDGVYARSKLEGENAIRTLSPQGSIIIRTSWVYSSFGSNFVHTMLKLGKQRDNLNVVCDQIGTPTYARDLAKSILDMLKNTSASKEVTTYHYSNEGVCSWYDFAHAIFEEEEIACIVNPISTEQYPTPAKRPHYSVLNKEKIKNDYSMVIPHWRESLKVCLDVLKGTKIK